MILRPPISTRTATLFPSTTCFRSGGRRRSELASLKVEQLVEELPVPVDPADPQGPQLPCMTIALGRTNTSDAEEGRAVKLVGRPVDARRRSEEHTSELQSLMRISYAVFCLKKNNKAKIQKQH